ncbi:odorant receptor 4-like [Temnothorax nylanderi]|uniref:odorant receptor 4-like n=1 Tax=Temnothorax nylanderi TaxID=102681 RepID=UPI003A8616D7
MFANKNYKRDVDHAFELSRFVFRLLGIWPYARTKSRLPETFERLAVVLVSYILLICELVPAILYMAVVQKETRGRLKVVATVIYTIMAMAKYGQLLFSRDRVRDCLAQVEDDWRDVESRDRDVMIDKARTGRRLLIICAIFMYSSGVSFRTAIPLSRGKIVTAQNVTIRHLPCPTYFVLFDVQLSPAYEIVFLMQFFSGFVKCTVTTAVCGLAGLFVMHICAQLEILMALMNNLVNEREFKNVNERLFATIVKHQIKTRNFLQLVQSTIQYTSLLEVIGCTIILCLIGYFVIMEWEDNNAVALCSYLVGLTSITFNIFIFCFIGEQLSSKGEKVALTACTLEWYRLPDTKARSLILIMVMSNSPTKLRGGKFIDLSFRTFGNVVKTAVTYLNLLRSVVG